MSESRVYTILKKELKSYLSQPLGYIIMIVFLLIWELLFFRNAFLVGESSLRGLFDLLPWLFLFFIPALTMNSLSGERSEGTLEWLLTHPLRPLELVLGKFLGSLIFVSLVLLLILSVGISFEWFGELDWGVVLAQYMASILLAAVLVSLGLWISSLFRSSIAALLVSVALSFLLLIGGSEFVTASLPLSLAPWLERLSPMSHFSGLARGVIGLADVWYFLSVIAIFLSLTYMRLWSERYAHAWQRSRIFYAKVVAVLLLLVVSNVFAHRLTSRIDVTQDNLYTITDSTRQVLADLEQEVMITLFASSQLPAQLQPTLRDIKDTLKDYQTLSGQRVKVATKDPASSPEMAQEAASQGVQAIQFNVVGRGELQVKSGYLGIVISSGEQHETIPFVQDPATLEYQLTSSIFKLTKKDKKKIAFLTGHGEKSIFSEYQGLNQELEKQFITQELALEVGKSVPNDIAALVIAGPTALLDDSVAEAVRQYINQGGSVWLMVEPVTVNPQLGGAQVNEGANTGLAEEWGVRVSNDLVYDLRSHERVRLGGGPVNYVTPYPLWPRVDVAQEGKTLLGNEQLQSVVVAWPSSVTADEAKIQERNLRFVPLLRTTQFASRQEGNFTIEPGQNLASDNLSQQVLAGALEGDNARLVVMGDSEWLTDQFIGGNPGNLGLSLAILSWMAQEQSLAPIQLKQKTDRRLLLSDQNQVSLLQYGNLAFVVMVPAVAGGVYGWRRKKLAQQSYTT